MTAGSPRARTDRDEPDVVARFAKERFLASTVAAKPAAGRALRDALGRDEHRAIAEDRARFL